MSTGMIALFVKNKITIAMIAVTNDGLYLINAHL